MNARFDERPEAHREKGNTLLAILLVFSVMISMLVVIPMGVHATTTGNINASAVIWNDGPDASTAYISGHDNPWAYGRFVFMKFDLSSLSAGISITSVRVFLYDASGSNSPVAINATYAFGGNGAGVSKSPAQLAAMSPASSFVVDMTFTSAGYWNASGMHSLWQTQFNNNQTIYIGASAWDWPRTVTSNGIGTSGGTIPYIQVTYNPAPAHWAPTFTSSPVTTGTDGVMYSEVISLNETCTITSVQIPSWMSNALNNTNTDSFMISGTAVTGSYPIKLRAVSVAGTLTAWQNFTLNVGSGWAPTFTSSPITTIGASHVYSYTATFNESSSIVVLHIPAWMTSIHNNSVYPQVIIYGTVLTMVGNYSISIQITSVAGTLSAWQNFTLTVTPFTPWFAYVTNAPLTTVKVGEPYYWVPHFNESVTVPSSFGTVDIAPDTGTGITHGTSGTIGSINVGFQFYGAGLGVSWFNWSIMVTAAPYLNFTSTPGAAINHTAYQYVYALTYGSVSYNGTNYNVVVTKAVGPTWLTVSGGKLKGTPPSTGVFSVSLMAHDTSPYNEYSWQNFTLTVLPTNTQTPTAGALDLIIPLMTVTIAAAMCAISRKGISISAGMGGLAIAIAVLTWSETLPWWAYILSMAIVAIMVVKEVRTQ